MKCDWCGELKPLDAFYDRPANRSGKDGRCKVCRDKYTQQYRNAEPAAYLRQKERNAARHRAHTRLARLYPGVFARLLAEELS